jgi:hypothetical protein
MIFEDRRKYIRSKLLGIGELIIWYYQFFYRWRRQGDMKVNSVFLNRTVYFFTDILIVFQGEYNDLLLRSFKVTQIPRSFKVTPNTK